MCIACELGYWAMIDALEAERNAAKKSIAVEDPPLRASRAPKRLSQTRHRACNERRTSQHRD